MLNTASGDTQEALSKTGHSGSSTSLAETASASEKDTSNDIDASTLSGGDDETETEKGDALTKVEKELSEDELRRLFDDEEIERFLELFANSVSEVAIADALVDKDSLANELFKEEKREAQLPEAALDDTCGDDWLSIDSSKVPSPLRIPPTASNARDFSEYIAFTYLLPSLPPARPRPERFTLGRLRTTIQRLFFVTHPAYHGFFSRLTHLGTWKNKRESTFYCSLFWLLWYHNLLMPATFFRILCSLLRRRFLPYPTLEELRSRRHEAALTEELGAQIQVRLGTASSSDLLEAWRLFRVFTKPNKVKAKQKQTKPKDQKKGKRTEGKEKDKKGKRKEQAESIASGEEDDKVAAETSFDLSNAGSAPDLRGEATVLDTPNESQVEKDFKRELLNSLDDLADLHERVKNIFLWRLPSSSRAYMILLSLLTILTIFLPTKYIVKMALFIIGFLYWHVIPILAALPPSERVRLPPLFENSPTDAEYAMGLISRRIARGEDMRPPVKKHSAKKQRKKSKRTDKAKLNNNSTESFIGDEQLAEASDVGSVDEGSAERASIGEGGQPSSDRPGEVDWRKWGERAHNLKTWTTQMRKKSREWKDGGNKQATDENHSGETHTFLAHYKASPGTLAICRTALLFTPVTSTRPKIRIALDDVRGVKKIGLDAIPGLSVKWQRSPGARSFNETEAEAIGDTVIVEEKFRWIGGRDEVFARLVGWGGRKWLKVLAATLGSKSSFKKLPRRSIQTADIPQLCNLICHPSEPLALRLSSNLMVGVARVFKIKHEIFITDVSNCLAHLKKAVQEIHALGALSEAQLQMGQPSVRPDALTLTADPAIALAFEFDAFDANWADLSGFGTRHQRDDEDDDDEFTPGAERSKAKAKGKSKASLIPSETGRANLHTLNEEHLLSTSFDANGSFLAGIDPSSSQVDPIHFGSFAYDDNIFGPGDNFDFGLGDIDDLARELGEGWGADVPNDALGARVDIDQQPDFNTGGDFDMGFDQAFENLDIPAEAEDGESKATRGRKRPFAGSDKENLPPGLDKNPALTPRSILSHHSQASFAEELVANDNQVDIPEVIESQNKRVPGKPKKKVRILLDVRTELTDAELKAAREHYVESQQAIRLEMERKKLEKDGAKALEDLIWGVPEGLTAPALTNFWSEVYKVQVESRSGDIHLDGSDERPAKRQKKSCRTADHAQDDIDGAYNFGDNDYAPMDYDFGGMDVDIDVPVNFDDMSRMRSSEEPERGRHAGLLASPQFGFDVQGLNPSSGTQRSAFFPWDNAAATSSSAGAGFAPIGEKGSERLSLDNADVHIMRPHSHSSSRRGSLSFIPSQSGSMVGLNFGMSPSGHRGSAVGDDFQFDVTNDGPTGQDTQETTNVVTLERTSYNFLEYCKMQAQALPGNQNILGFTDIVPSMTSSRRVAAAAFHHCLVLATKDLITVQQDETYGSLSIKIK